MPSLSPKGQMQMEREEKRGKVSLKSLDRQDVNTFQKKNFFDPK